MVFCNTALADRAKYIRKQVNQLPSKMRFVAAQFLALLDDDRWITAAAHANAMTRRLYDATRDLDGLVHEAEPVVNAVFPLLPRDVIRRLQDWSVFWDWDVPRGQVRWMTAWDTTPDDVDRFVEGVRVALAEGSLQTAID